LGFCSGPRAGAPLLKVWIERAGFYADLHYLNMSFAQRLGLRAYEEIATQAYPQTEWFFSQALFGPAYLNELQNCWHDLSLNPLASPLTRSLLNLVSNSNERCVKIAEGVGPFIEDCLEHTDWGQYLVVGFTVSFAQSLASLLLSKRIKDRFPRVKVVFGGANVDSEMGVEFIRGFEWIDYVVHGEAEPRLHGLLAAIASDRVACIPGVSARNGQHVVVADTGNQQPPCDLDASPIPDYSDYVRALDTYGFKNKLPLKLNFESSRGCWWGTKHHCTFCGLNGADMTYRRKSAARMFSEIFELVTKYRCLALSATDNILAPDYFKELFPKLVALDIDLQLFYEVKANLTRAQVKALRDAGVRRIQPGVESFNARILQHMRKGVTPIQNIQVLKWCYEYEIDASWNIPYGFPGECPADYDDLPRILRLLAHLRPPHAICEVMFERFSPYVFDRDKFGLELSPLSAYQFIYPQQRVDLEKIAYFFDGKWTGQVDKPREYIQPALDEWRQWKDEHAKQSVFCYHDKGPDFLIIYDNRPRVSGGALTCRRTFLDEQLGALYLFCDAHQAFGGIREMMQNRFGTGVDEDKIRRWLDQLVYQGLMFREHDRYLSLAVRRKPQLPAA
jgi:ribosomal peptide maturation radical SAM protein 1